MNFQVDIFWRDTISKNDFTDLLHQLQSQSGFDQCRGLFGKSVIATVIYKSRNTESFVYRNDTLRILNSRKTTFQNGFQLSLEQSLKGCSCSAE